MKIIKVLISIPKLPFALSQYILSYYARKIVGQQETKKEWNVKQLALVLKEANGKLSDYSKDFYSGHIVVNNNKFNFKLRTEVSCDVSVLNEFVCQNEYDALFDAMKKEYNSADEIFLMDLGGNIGLFSFFTKFNYKNAIVAYVEPDLEAIEVYKNLCTLNNMHNGFIYNNGIANEENLNINLGFGPRGEGNAGFVTTFSTQESTLKTTSINKILSDTNRSKIDVLKIDIEGAESDLILGTNFNQELANKINFISIEIHDEQVDRIAIETKLQSLGFSKIFNGRADVFKQNKSI